jgi:sugar/nucleoside kinase (ribokinase family)
MRHSESRRLPVLPTSPRGDRKLDVLCVGLLTANIPVRPIDRGVFDVDATPIERVEILPGGDAFNQAVILSRLGARVGLAGRVGRDHFCQVLLAAARESAVDVTTVRVGEEANTSVAILLIQEDGSRNFCTYKGANGLFSISDVDLTVLGGTRIVSIGGLFAMPAFDGGGAEALMAEAKRCGAITSADTKHDVLGIGFAGVAGMLKHTDYFLPSRDEAAHMTGERDVARMASALLDAGARNVLIKLGADGCYLRTADRALAVPPVWADVVDTTGAGDNFVAGFLTGISRGWEIERCARYANAVGSLSTTAVGSVTAVRNMEQVLAHEKAGRS